MKNKVFQTEYAGHVLRYSLLYPATRYCFSPFLTPVEGKSYDVAATSEDIEEMRSMLPDNSRDAYIEYRVLSGLTSNELLKYDCCIFHCVSFVWRKRAFLLTAPPGTGKTTQFLNWQRLFPGELTMISGDMPVLEHRKDGSIWVYPTSWNGKENIGNRISAQTAGIVLLEQGQVNSIVPLSPSEALIPLFEQFLVAPETEEQIKSLARLLDGMMRSARLYKLTNLGDDASTRLLRNTLLAATEEENGNANV